MTDPEETLEDFKSRIIIAATEFDLSDDFHEFKTHDPDAAYHQGIDRVIMLIKGEISNWTDPLPVQYDI